MNFHATTTLIPTAGGAEDMWIPFGLPGQLILDKTIAYASGGGFTHTRPALALNQWRVYDPLIGAFLQPDGADLKSRLAPEGYVFARAAPTEFTDPSGLSSRLFYSFGDHLFNRLLEDGIGPGVSYQFDSSCNDEDRLTYMIAHNLAFLKLVICAKGICGSSRGKRAWLATLSLGEVHCRTANNYNTRFGPDGDWAPGVDGVLHSPTEGDAYALSREGPDGRSLFSAFALEDSSECLASVIAHEAVHRSIDILPVYGINPVHTALWPLLPFALPTSVRRTLHDEETFVENSVEDCFDCTGPMKPATGPVRWSAH
jgi:RHS repeat-associated protein